MAKAIAIKSRVLKPIKLSAYGKTMGEIRRFRKDIFEKMGDEVYTISDWNKFIYESLKKVYPITIWIQNNDVSLNKALKVICTHFFGSIEDFSNFTESPISLKDFYKYHILSIDKLPSDTYFELESNVKEHLLELNTLVKRYENEDFIIKHLTKGLSPSHHEEAIIYDFYKRCINEQKVVLDYYLTGIKTRALQKALYFPLNFGLIFTINQRWYDYPYEFASPWARERFDHNLIDESAHRVAEIRVTIGNRIKTLYKINKAKYYRELFKENSRDQIFQNLDFHLQHLPLKNDRTAIFNELKKLFRSRKWMAFYALALPQVEGLFTEMQEIVDPKKKGRALSDKVDTVRPYYNLSASYFDYYQYIVPRMRNKFMHTGYDEDFQLKAFDLLTDLDHILRVFYEIDNPLVKLKRLHIRRNPEDFISYKDFASYFVIINSLTHQQRLKNKSEIETFEIDFIMTYTEVNFIIEQLVIQLPELNDRMITSLEYHIGSASLAYNLKHLPMPKITDMLKDISLLKKFQSFFNHYYEEAENLESYFNFISGYQKHLPSLSTDAINALDTIKKEEGVFIKNMMEIKKYILEYNEYENSEE
ncbi:MAG: hypothetical protein EWV91_21445 [Microcystis aeruginosa Ma_QC_Ca_00000000_S207]|uniref:Uncharacterized protein n=1 Tax=Microcystis aeruginosa Ma_QC_Ca_00000000_S207 TaxID=2486251 RepID=A0A552F450_MICAE|nr:MAG: hypothetical protein EWV91_21445 [Microcystis aeruginosa Ma_QC_Ca_00000000_S207]